MSIICFGWNNDLKALFFLSVNLHAFALWIGHRLFLYYKVLHKWKKAESCYAADIMFAYWVKNGDSHLMYVSTQISDEFRYWTELVISCFEKVVTIYVDNIAHTSAVKQRLTVNFSNAWALLGNEHFVIFWRSQMKPCIGSWTKIRQNQCKMSSSAFRRLQLDWIALSLFD